MNGKCYKLNYAEYFREIRMAQSITIVVHRVVEVKSEPRVVSRSLKEIVEVIAWAGRRTSS